MLADLITKVTELHGELIGSLRDNSTTADIHPNFRASAENLLHYLTLRRRDLRWLQDQLARHGLSSLGRAESHVLSTVQAVLHALHALACDESDADKPGISAADWNAGPTLLNQHTDALFGPPPEQRSARIMVTMPEAAAFDSRLVRDLIAGGMDCMRINCAHDDAATWMRMIENLREAERDAGRSCRISMDLAGPKLRTGPLEPLAGVVKVRPRRDDYGRVVVPGRALLYPEGMTLAVDDTANCIPVSGEILRQLQPGHRLRFRDARGALRTLTTVTASDNGCLVEARQTCYFVAGSKLRVREQGVVGQLSVGSLPERDNALLLRPGDILVLTRCLEPGRPAVFDDNGACLAPATIGCTLPEVFKNLLTGHRILFDDGRIGGVVETISDTAAHVRITRSGPVGIKLRSDKGINLPDTELDVSPLTAKDLADLPFACQYADMIALSFANTPRDVRMLVEAIERAGTRRPAIILKVETRRGFQNLPAMLLEAMRSPACGVMIARGDLAVECGFERMAELQEEILWICEAAHVPVIWATQVLENLTKDGLPSRAEITDAAMGDRAECVMLNKGPHIRSAVLTLANILQRMHTHQSKKRAMLRGLRLAHDFFSDSDYEPPAHRG
jgi:pyruvate kinase